MSKKKKTFIYLREVELKYKLKKIDSKIIGHAAIDPQTVFNMFADLRNDTKEKMLVVSLDARNKILCFEVVAMGSVESISILPKEIFRSPISLNAASIILIHNHPSGDPAPSHADKEFTKEIKDIAERLGFYFHDHIIIGVDDFFSFAKECMLFLK